MAVTHATLMLIVLLSVGLPFGDGATFAGSTLIGSTIMEIGPDGRQVTIKTLQGESHSLDVANPEIMKGMRKGDQVSLELDAQDRVNKMVKVGEEAARPKPRMPSDSEY